MNVKIELRRKEIVNDVLVNCNMLARTLSHDEQERMQELAGDLMTPDDALTKPIVARSLTMGFGKVKEVCQKYLLYGREEDDNRLEKIDASNRYEETVNATSVGVSGTHVMLTGITHVVQAVCAEEVQITNQQGVMLARGTNVEFTYVPTQQSEYLKFKTTKTAQVKVLYKWGDFGYYELALDMPERFNIGVTESIKSAAHGMIANYVMYAILKDQFADKATEYLKAHEADREMLRKSLIARTSYSRPYAADWS